MIPVNAALTAVRLPLSCIVLTPHDIPISPRQVMHYYKLLMTRPELDTDPIVVIPHGDAYTPTNGRHRFLAHALANRTEIPAIIITE